VLLTHIHTHTHTTHSLTPPGAAHSSQMGMPRQWLCALVAKAAISPRTGGGAAWVGGGWGVPVCGLWVVGMGGVVIVLPLAAVVPCIWGRCRAG
jgi:hypothetical protein